MICLNVFIRIITAQKHRKHYMEERNKSQFHLSNIHKCKIVENIKIHTQHLASSSISLNTVLLIYLI